MPTSNDFQLLETILIEAGVTFLRQRHVERLLSAAAFFQFSCAAAEIQSTLAAAEHVLPSGRYRLRLLVDRSGRICTHCVPLCEQHGRGLSACFASKAVNSQDPFLRHKTTWRRSYDVALAQNPTMDDVILCNDGGWVTESCKANVVARIGGELLTPPEDCGLLPGTFRAELLAAGVIREARIDREMLGHAEALYLVNSVRKWMPTQLRCSVGTSQADDSATALGRELRAV